SLALKALDRIFRVLIAAALAEGEAHHFLRRLTRYLTVADRGRHLLRWLRAVPVRTGVRNLDDLATQRDGRTLALLWRRCGVHGVDGLQRDHAEVDHAAVGHRRLRSGRRADRLRFRLRARFRLLEARPALPADQLLLHAFRAAVSTFDTDDRQHISS